MAKKSQVGNFIVPIIMLYEVEGGDGTIQKDVHSLTVRVIKKILNLSGCRMSKVISVTSFSKKYPRLQRSLNSCAMDNSFKGHTFLKIYRRFLIRSRVYVSLVIPSK